MTINTETSGMGWRMRVHVFLNTPFTAALYGLSWLFGHETAVLVADDIEGAIRQMHAKIISDDAATIDDVNRALIAASAVIVTIHDGLRQRPDGSYELHPKSARMLRETSEGAEELMHNAGVVVIEGKLHSVNCTCGVHGKPKPNLWADSGEGGI